MKIYQKKNASLEDETVLVQLERRHTVKEVTDEVRIEDLRKTTRTNSLGTFESGQSSTDVEAITIEKKSGFKRRPTVITESELASSSLYKDRKAKINSDDESIEDPKSTLPPEIHEDLEPRALNDPKLKPVPVPSQRPRKISSCCWYFAIILVIFIACLAVMAGVGGIVYMEYFATYSKVDITDGLEKNDKNPSDSKEIFQHPPHKQENLLLNEPKIPENILKDIVENSGILEPNTDVSREVPVVISQPKRGIPRNKNLSDSGNSKTKVLNDAKRSFVSINQDMEMTEHSKIAEHSDSFRDNQGRIRLFKVPIKDKSIEIKKNAKNQDSIDLKLNFQSMEDIMDKIPDKHANDINKQMAENESVIDEKLNSVAKVSDSNDGTSASFRNFNLGEISTLQGFELKVEQVGENMPIQNLPKEDRIEHLVHPLPNDSSFDKIKNSNSIDNKPEGDFFDQRKHSIDFDLKDNSLDHAKHSVDHSLEDNSLDQDPLSIGHSHEDNSLEDVEHFIDHSLNHTSLDHDENSIDNSFDDNSLNHVEHSIDHSLEVNSLDHAAYSIDHSHEDNSLEHVEHFIDHSLKHTSLDHDENSIDNSFEDTSLDHVEHSIGHSLEDSSLDNAKHSIGRSTEDTSLGSAENFIDKNLGSNSLDHAEHTIDHNINDELLYLTEHMIHHNNKSLNDNNEDSSDFDSDDSSSEEHSLADDHNQNSDDSAQLVFIRPVVESKPVQVNVAFLKRMGIDIKNPNSQQPMTAEDMDIKFSLAEALKFLRSLDTDNKLPASREKTIPQKTSRQVKSQTTKLALITERNEYLNMLRKKMFDQNL